MDMWGCLRQPRLCSITEQSSRTVALNGRTRYAWAAMRRRGEGPNSWGRAARMERGRDPSHTRKRVAVCSAAANHDTFTETDQGTWRAVSYG